MKALKVFNLAFPPDRPPRSHAYRAGMLDALLCLLDGANKISLPYQMGSAEADAYLAGTHEARWLAQELQADRRPTDRMGHAC